MLNIGLTGGIGSGKSTVSQWFKERGVPVLDADKTVHRMYKSDRLTISKLVQEFGAEILKRNGEIDRSILGVRVFSDDAARKQLSRILRGRIAECMQEEQAAVLDTGAKFCIWDVPLLIESGFVKFVDKVWVVWVPRELQIERVLARDNNLSRADVEARIDAQGSLDEKRKHADVVIDNSGSALETERQLEELWKKLNLLS